MSNFTQGQILTAVQLNAAFNALGDLSGTVNLGSGSVNWITISGGANPQIAVNGAGPNAALLLRPLGTGAINMGPPGNNMLQLLPTATVGDTMSITQPAVLGSPFLIQASGGTASGGFTFQRKVQIGSPVTLSGTLGSGPVWLTVGNNLSGTNTVQQGVLNTFGSNSDTATPNGGAGSLTMLDVHDRLAAGWTGSRVGIWSSVSDIAATTQTNATTGMIGLGANVNAQFNRGGVSSGFGVTQFGVGNQFGAVIGAGMTAAATYLRSNIGFEIDIHALAGSSISVQVGMQIVHDAAHAVQGTNTDVAFRISDQTSVVGGGWKNAIMVGGYDSQWPVDANGYLFQVVAGANNGAKPVAGAGGFDLNQMNVAGTGPEGGGFLWRSPGVKIRPTEVAVGYGALTNDANGLAIDATYQQMATAAGAITAAAGGINFSTGDIVADVYGNTLVVTAAAGAITGISAVLTRGWQTVPPADPVAVTARTRSGAALGTGATLNYGAWTARAGVTIASAGTKLGFYGTAPIAKPTGVAVSSAGIHAALVSLGLIAA